MLTGVLSLDQSYCGERQVLRQNFLCSRVLGFWDVRRRQLWLSVWLRLG